MDALVGVENVHHHVSKIEEHPASPALSFAADGPVACRRQLLLHAVGDGLQLAVAASAPDDQEVGVAGHPAQVEDHHILGLLLQGSAGGGNGCPVGILVDASGGSRGSPLRSGGGLLGQRDLGGAPRHSLVSSLAHVRTWPSPRTT